MNALVTGGLAALVAAGVSFLSGLWLGRRQRSAREAQLEARLAGLQHVVDVQRDTTGLVTERVMSAMGDLVERSIAVLRRQRERP
ncbi:hypothetical protein [Amycolatopsis sp. NPDC051128]|uniref:hypothetical protein n=1 Tax=Amycolatopsis sp. NPDC051128 TaxID=3155412 RepID=UPI003424CCD4